MKVLLIVDNIDDINKKINLLTSKFGNDISYIVNYKYVKLFETYGYTSHAVYGKDLANSLHRYALQCDKDDLIICYSSLNFTEELLTRFLSKIIETNKVKAVNIIPHYNGIEKCSNSIYNVYVKSMFKNRDSMASPKLQFLPAQCAIELLNSHIANRLFVMNDSMVTNIYIENKEISSSAKVKTKFNKYHIIPLISALLITLALILSIAFGNVKYYVVVIFITLYLLDIFISIIFMSKSYFDQRFLR